MQQLLPAEPRIEAEPAEVDLHAFYAGDGWLDDGGVRINFIASVDGAATVAGLSRGLQTPGDNRVFAALRDLADVILVGAATASAEGYRPSVPGADRRALRTRYGLAEAPAIAVVSASLELDLSAPLYRAAEAAPTVLITSSAAPVGRRNDIIDLASGGSRLQLIEAPAAGAGVDLAAAVTNLRDLGYRRILCEGGPRLFAAGVAAGVVEELCLSYSPLLAGPTGSRILAGTSELTGFPAGLELIGLLTEESALFARYRVLR